MTRLLSVVGLAWLYCTVGELQPIEYLKSVFLEILNVTTWTVFQNKVTYLHAYDIHYIVVTWARVVCLIYTPKARGPQARGLRVYISGKPRVPMLQLLCTTYL